MGFLALGVEIQAFVFSEFFHMSAEDDGTLGTGLGGVEERDFRPLYPPPSYISHQQIVSRAQRGAPPLIDA